MSSVKKALKLLVFRGLPLVSGVKNAKNQQFVNVPIFQSHPFMKGDLGVKRLFKLNS